MLDLLKLGVLSLYVGTLLQAELEQLGRSVFGGGWYQGAAMELERHWPCSHCPGPPTTEPQRKD